VFLSVPTPFDCNLNKVDDSAIQENLEILLDNSYEGIVIIKSTIPVGATDKYLEKYKLKLIFNPEFLRESTTPNEDFEKQETVVIGTNSKKLFQETKEMYEQVLLNETRYYQTSAIEAEMIKCGQNTMLASRVALANMIYDACQIHEIDYDKVKKIAFDSFEILGPHMVKVPGPDGKRGFGGKCLPKDIRAFSSIYNSELLDAIINYNDSLREDLDRFLVNFIKK